MKQEACRKTGTGFAQRVVAVLVAVSMVVSFAPSFTGLAWAADSALSTLSTASKISVGTTYTIAADDVDDEGMLFYFTPSSSGLYSITFSGCEVDVSLYIDEDDDSWCSYDYFTTCGSLVEYLDASTKYYLRVWVYGSGTDSVDFTVSKADVQALTGAGSATATVSEEGGAACFSLTPSESGWYALSSEGDSGTMVRYPQTDNPQLDGASISWLVAGTTYYFFAYFYDESWGVFSSETGELTVTVTQIDPVDAEADASYDVTLGASDTAVFSFVPTETRYYEISALYDDDFDGTFVGYLLDEDLNEIDYYWEFGVVDFSIGNRELTAGETYYAIFLTYDTSDDWNFTISFTGKNAISDATVKLSKSSYTYDGTAKKPAVTVKYDGATLTKGTDYTVSYSNNKNVGTARVKITGKGEYGGSISKTFTIKKASQSLKVTAAKKTVKASKLKKKAQSVSAVTVKNAKTTLTYKKVSGSKKLSVNSKTGKITVKKGTGKSTYKIKVKVTAKGTSNYKAASKNVTVKVTVK